MPKINQEEYEVLKGLDDKWKWIARNYNGALIIYTSKPMENPNLYWDSFGERMDDRLFQFIQWEDEEPHEIAELIEEYEYSALERHVNSFKELSKAIRTKESEETEVNKDIQWLKREIHKELESWHGVEGGIDGDGINEIMLLINQHEESEVKRLERKIKELDSYNDELIRDNNQLRNALDNREVLSQELPVIPQWVADNIESKKRVGTRLNVAMSEFPEFKLEKELNIDEHECNEIYARAWLDGYEVVEEQRYYLKIGNLYLAEPLGDMTSDIVRMTRDKGVAYQFTDEKSIATHLDKFEGTEAVKVEELEE